jgi:hypothetical protein
MDSRPPHAQRHRRRRHRREDGDCFEFAAEDGPDPRDQRAVGILVVAVVILLLVVCATLIVRSMDLERFPGM